MPYVPERPLPAALAHERAAHSLTLRRLLTAHLDPFSVPRRSFFELISHFSPPEHMEHEKLVEYLQPGEGPDDMYEYAQRVRRTMAEVLYEFKSVQVPVAYVMELFPTLRERQYSIASAPSVRGLLCCASDDQLYGHRVQLVVALVKYKTRLQQPREGVCSAWIRRLLPGACVLYYMQALTQGHNCPSVYSMDRFGRLLTPLHRCWPSVPVQALRLCALLFTSASRTARAIIPSCWDVAT